MKEKLRRICKWYVHFVDHQGFPIIVTVCVAVITATALWTGRSEAEYVAPTPPVGQSISAAQLLQQSLQNASTSTPSPTSTARTWLSPLENTEVLYGFSTDTFKQGNRTGLWQIHDAVDLRCSPGDPVRAMANGSVLDDGHDDLYGSWLLIDHGDGIEALYAGMALNAAYTTGDAVKAGATIGFAGKGLLEEADLPPHLHLRVTQNDVAIDPVTLWLQ